VKKALAWLVTCILVLSVFVQVGLCQEKMQPLSFKAGAVTAKQAVEENPISVPDWWDMTIDLVGTMALKAIKSGNVNVTISDGGVPGAFIVVYEGGAINVVWGVNREGKFIGIEPSGPLSFQEKIKVEEFQNIRPQLIYDYDNRKLQLAIEYDFRA